MKKNLKFIRNIIIVFIFLIITFIILKLAPNYVKTTVYDKTNIIINNNNITENLKYDMLIENNNIYLSKADIYNFFDPYIYYDASNERVITTYQAKVAAMTLNNPSATINGIDIELSAYPILKDDILYIPFSALSMVYDVEISKNEDTNTIVVDSLNKKQVVAIASKKLSIKSKARFLSKTLTTVAKAENVVLVTTYDSGWAKVRTSNGIIGFVHKNDLTNTVTVREDREGTLKQVNGKINLVWDYYSEYVEAPNRTGTKLDGVNVVCPSLFVLEKLGKGEVYDKVGTSGKAYINWAKSNGYQVWGMVANDSMIETTSEIMNSYEYRSKLIENIVKLALEYNLDGINIDFEYMYDKDIDLFTQFLVELHPRLKEYCVTLSVDVTAPDGGANWSTCYNRNEIADNCDYIIFMAYDQYGLTASKAGTTAGYDWIEINLNKFLTYEEINPEKLILGLPFYTRLWKTSSNGVTTNSTINMKDIESVLPSNVETTWLDDLRQNYVEYVQNGTTYKMWIEDEKSMTEKLSLIREHNLAGAAFWEKDRESDSIWPIINQSLAN